ncbi:hypothetical protein [Streptomyces sp. JB150]|uniref:hypothetical protein n=1 Tax=Streptomyces sp. JB150 TaxID=2714844 RepID=UPI001409F043|nr:hypothetical protein [Streptomyces sp. JB150]QIJ65006.1 hypothetical protein G7Z13_25500 [Streptomyces sp. JB150]
MRPLYKIGAFGAALAASFAAAYGIGDAVSPLSPDTGGAGGHEPAAHSSPAPGDTAPGNTTPGGLQISQNGYTLDLRTPRVPAGEPAALRFVIRDADGRPVTDYRREHEKDLHLIVASRDLTTYRHLHPTRTADGTWTTRTTLPDPGGYRVLADFTPAAEREGLTLGADLAVSGTYTPDTLPAPATTTTVDGYEVTLDGTLKAGGASDLTFTVRRDGEPAALQPYLGAYGHLVALRSGDLAYLHVHPHEEAHGTAASGPKVAFSATAPSRGTYRLFLDFRTGGEVHTAAFTVRADEQPAPTAEQRPDKSHDEQAPHGH